MMKRNLFFLLNALLIMSIGCNKGSEANIAEKEGGEPKNNIRVDTVWQVDTIRVVERDTVEVEDTLKRLAYSRFTTQQSFYRNCLNPIYADLPTDGSQVVVSASSASVIPSKKDGRKYAIIPTGIICKVEGSILDKGSTVYQWTEDFRVIEPPMPTIEFVANGKTYDGTTPIPKNSRLNLRIVPDAEFLSSFTSDAKYGVENIDVLAQLSLGPPTKVNSIKGMNTVKSFQIPLGTAIKQARPGTVVYIRLNGIYRVNYKGQKVLDYRFRGASRVFSFVVK